MVDENAFGLLVAYHDIEDDEYGLERERFVERFELFRRVVLEYLGAHPLGAATRVVDLGHALYLELGEGDQDTGLIGWLRGVRAALGEREFASVGVLAHGSRWVLEGTAPGVDVTEQDGVGVARVSTPSEPLRRALYAEAASRPDDDDPGVGWGPGLYLDTEAVDALEMRPKNAPTTLRASGASFYRAGS